jgi:hypothetical protein
VTVDTLAKRAGAARAQAKHELRRSSLLSRLPTTRIFGVVAGMRSRALDRMDAEAEQRLVLKSLVAKATRTRFGRDHDFARIGDVADFQARVPLRTYNQLWADYWKDDFPRLVDCTWPGTMPFFAVSSGTASGKVKYIPCSWDMVATNKRAAQDILVHHLRNRPDSRFLNGKAFVLGGSTSLVEQAPGIFSGDISGIAASQVPPWARLFYWPPMALRYITDWEEKIARIAPLALEADIRFLSGAPGWLAILFERLAALKPGAGGRIANIFPNLEVLVHGGVSFAPYRKRFEALLEGSRAELREVYPASEGFIAIADRGPQQGLRLNVDTGLFYEFVPVEDLGRPNPTRHWLGNVETGVDYAIVLNTCAGLWGYVIGDVVRFVDRKPPRLLITGRTSYMLSSFGEHLTGELVETAVLAAADRIGAQVSEFSVGTRFAEDRTALGHHVYVVEFVDSINDPARIEAFTATIDETLAEANEDYQERRAVDVGVRAPVVLAVPPGFFASWMKALGRLGGQNKVPRVITDASLFQRLIDFANQYNG